MSESGVHIFRNSLRVTLSVWKALLLREALSRLFSSRGAWFWLLAEPVVHMAILGFLFTAVRQHTVGGIDFLIWLVIGLQGFFLFRRTATQMGGAIASNRALFAYRQVVPIDTVLMRGTLELLLMIAVILVIFLGMFFLNHDIIPANMMLVVASFLGLWLLAVGLGLIVSVAAEIADEARQIMNMVLIPLYFISGVMVPIAGVPEPYRDWLLLNPIVHGLDSAREGFSPYYHSVPGLSLGYLYDAAMVAIFIGLLLHRRFADLIVKQ